MTRRRIARVLSALLVSAIGLSVAASPAAAESSLEVEPGYGGYVLTGKDFPVRVSARTDRLVRGRIEVTANTRNGPGGSVTVGLPVEIPGGGAKAFVVVVPGLATFPGGTIAVEARLVEGEKASVVAKSPSAATRSADDRELVGLLTEAAGDRVPETMPLAIDAGVAQFFPITPVLLGLAPGSLDALGTLVASEGELGRLTPPVRRGVLAWLDEGGTLLVDAPLGAPLDGVPEPWQPGADGTSSAGLGRVRLVPGLITSGNFEGVIFPTPRRTVSDPRFGGFGGPISVGNSLAAEAGLRVPRLGWLLGFLLLYTVVVGPLAGIILNRRNRAELAWVVVPLAAVVFAAGSYTAARGLRSGTRLAHGSVITLSPAGSSATTFVGVAAQRRQTTEVGFGDRAWKAGRAASGFNDVNTANVDVTDDGPVTQLRLAAGQFAVASLRGPVASPGGLQLTATSAEDGEAEGTVKNGLDDTLEEVIVLVGTRGVNVGRLGPGEERAWRTDLRVGRADGFMGPFPAPEMSLWRDASGQFGPPDPNTPVNFAVWQASPSGSGSGRSTGTATAVGWSRDQRLPIRIDGRPRAAKGRTAIATTVAVVPRGRITDMTVQAHRIRGGFENFGGDPGNGTLGRVTRFVLPPGAPITRDFVAVVPEFGGGVEVWDGGKWVNAGGAGADIRPDGIRNLPRPVPMQGPEGAMTDVPVPRSAVVAGQVFLRLGQNVPMMPGGISLREAR